MELCTLSPFISEQLHPSRQEKAIWLSGEFNHTAAVQKPLNAFDGNRALLTWKAHFFKHMASVLSAPGLSDYENYRMSELKGSPRNVFLVPPFQFERMREQKHEESHVPHLFLPTILRAQVHLPLSPREVNLPASVQTQECFIPKPSVPVHWSHFCKTASSCIIFAIAIFSIILRKLLSLFHFIS